MTHSPNITTAGVICPHLFINDDDVTNKIHLHELNIYKAVNRIPSATIVILDGDMPNQDFPKSNSDDFAPGQSIKITISYGNQTPATLFIGIIIKHAISINNQNQSLLTLECKDEAIKLTIGRNNSNFIKQSDGSGIKDNAVISSILNKYPELKTDIAETSAETAGIVQYNATDWDFIVSRAEANAMLVMANDGTFTVAPPDLNAKPPLSVTYGTDIISFEAELDPRYQFKKVTGVSWNPDQHTVLEEPVAPVSDDSERHKKNGNLANVLNLDNYRMQTQSTQVQGALSSWGNSQQLKSHLSALQGQVVFQGSGKIQVGDNLELNGVGSRFNGNVFVSSLQHEIRDGNWFTTAGFGLSQEWFSQRDDVIAPAASGLMPAAEGLQIGIVKQLDQDPEGQYRIMVTIPVLQVDEDGIWARLVQFYASSGFGLFFIPEIGDEVVVGYFNNDPSCPVILGSLYSAKHAPPSQLTEDNFHKTLVTKSGLTCSFDDEKKIINWQTPGGHSIVMDDEQQSITITDSNKNSVTMDNGGIALSSPKDITLKASGNIVLSANGNIEATATGDAKLAGTNIQQSAKASFSAQGSASAEVKASGTTTIKGAMVMIN